MTKLEIRYIATEALVPYARNAKTHPPEQVSQIAGSLKEFGFINPVVVDKDRSIVAGHGRVLAAQKLGLTEVPTISAEHLTPAQVKAFRLADNRIAQNGSWDEEMLKLELEELDNLGVDLEGLGFNLDELPSAEGNPGLSDPDDVPEEPKEVWVKPGDLFELGNHRLLCGDSTKREDVERLMAGEKADMVFTDPPYGVDYEGVNNDHLKADALRSFVAAALSCADKFLKDGGCYYIFHPDIHAYEFVGAVRDVGWVQARPPVLLWVKDSLVLGRGDYHSRSEPILYGWKPGAGHLQLKDRSQDNVWEFPKPKAAEGHPTMKPVALVERAINNSSRSAEHVYEPFAGGGSTLIACEKTGRRCYGMEIDPAYCQVILERWSKFSGKQWAKIES